MKVPQPWERAPPAGVEQTSDPKFLHYLRVEVSMYWVFFLLLTYIYIYYIFMWVLYIQYVYSYSIYMDIMYIYIYTDYLICKCRYMIYVPKECARMEPLHPLPSPAILEVSFCHVLRRWWLASSSPSQPQHGNPMIDAIFVQVTQSPLKQLPRAALRSNTCGNSWMGLSCLQSPNFDPQVWFGDLDDLESVFMLTLPIWHMTTNVVKWSEI